MGSEYTKRRKNRDIRPNKSWEERKEEKKVQKTLEEFEEEK